MRRILILSLLFISFCGISYAENRQLVDRVAAVVNNEVITQSEFDMIFRPVYEQIRQNYHGPNPDREIENVRLKLLNQLIEDRLVYQEAQKLGITATDSELDEELQAFKSQFKDEATFQEEMEKAGVAISEIEKRIRERISIAKLHQSVIRSRIIVAPSEIEKYFKEHPEEFVEKEEAEVWSITIPKGEDAVKKGVMDEKAKRKTEDLLGQIKKGGDFQKLAKENSQDSWAPEGGSLGLVKKGTMASNIDKAIFKLPENSTSDVMETEEAYHIFKIGKKRKASKKNYEEAKNEITEKLFREKAHGRFTSWMEDLKKRSYISVR